MVKTIKTVVILALKIIVVLLILYYAPHAAAY